MFVMLQMICDQIFGNEILVAHLRTEMCNLVSLRIWIKDVLCLRTEIRIFLSFGNRFAVTVSL